MFLGKQLQLWHDSSVTDHLVVVIHRFRRWELVTGSRPSTWFSFSSAISATTRDSMNFTRSLPWILVWEKKRGGNGHAVVKCIKRTLLSVGSHQIFIKANLLLTWTEFRPVGETACSLPSPAPCGWRQRWSSALWCACVRRCDCLCTGQAYSSLQTPPSFHHGSCGSQRVGFSSRQPDKKSSRVGQQVNRNTVTMTKERRNTKKPTVMHWKEMTIRLKILWRIFFLRGDRLHYLTS